MVSKCFAATAGGRRQGTMLGDAPALTRLGGRAWTVHQGCFRRLQNRPRAPYLKKKNLHFSLENPCMCTGYRQRVAEKLRQEPKWLCVWTSTVHRGFLRL